jgi:glucans biosynthesis protein C
MRQETISNKRLVYLDHLKVALTILVALHHLAITYGGEGGWYYYERGDSLLASVLLTMFNAVNQSFFMGLFFLISGYTTPASYDRKGAARFLKDRIVRFGIPLLVFMLLIDPLLWYVSTGFTGGFLRYVSEQVLTNPWRGVTDFEPGPLWFLFALLLFNLSYVLYRRLASRTQGELTTRTLALTTKLIITYLAVAGAANFLVRIGMSIGEEVLSLQLGYFPAYCGMFFGGIAAYRGQWLGQLTTSAARKWMWASVTMILLLPIVMALGGALEGNGDAFKGGLTWQSAFYSILDPVLGFAISYALLVWFRERFNQATKRTMWMSAHAFMVYVLHALVVTYAAYWLRGLELHPLLKFALVGAAVVPLCFVAAAMAMRIPGAKRVF